MDQKLFLNNAKSQLGLTWDALAAKANIKPRALKTYRMPPDSGDRRPMPPLAKDAINRLLAENKGLQ